MVVRRATSNKLRRSGSVPASSNYRVRVARTIRATVGSTTYLVRGLPQTSVRRREFPWQDVPLFSLWLCCSSRCKLVERIAILLSLSPFFYFSHSSLSLSTASVHVRFLWRSLFLAARGNSTLVYTYYRGTVIFLRFRFHNLLDQKRKVRPDQRTTPSMSFCKFVNRLVLCSIFGHACDGISIYGHRYFLSWLYCACCTKHLKISISAVGVAIVILLVEFRTDLEMYVEINETHLVNFDLVKVYNISRRSQKRLNRQLSVASVNFVSHINQPLLTPTDISR